MLQRYFEEKVKHNIVKLHLEEITLKSLAEEYGVTELYTTEKIFLKCKETCIIKLTKYKKC